MVAAALYIVICCIASISAVQVQVSQGLLEGEELVTVTGDTKYYSFKGIPYAQPPIGNLRFMPPQSPAAWDGVRNATEHGASCPQYDIFTSELIPGNEDCLYLNVYTTNLNATSNLPVMFFIHGGGFKSGSGNVSNYGPDFLVDKDVVVVTINYRLDVLGYLSLDTAEVPGNAAMKDQVEALKWVRDNIENFGGSPNNITIMGQSAGGASVALHLISPMSRGLFQRAIAMSGAPNCDFAMPFHAKLRAFVLGKLLGNDTRDPNALLEFLQSVPAIDLVNADVALLASEGLSNNNLLKSYYFTPVVETDFGGEHFLTEQPLDAVRNGNIYNVEILFGNTNEEAVSGIPSFVSSVINLTERYPESILTRNILSKVDPEVMFNISDAIRQRYFGNKTISPNTMREFITYANEAYIMSPVRRFFSMIAQYCDSTIYSYVFSSFSTRNLYGSLGANYGIFGSGHLDELWYLFDPKSANMTISKDSADYVKVNLISTVFTNFAKYGNPTPDSSLGLVWPLFDSTDKSYVNIANDTLVQGSDAYGDAVEFWKTMSDSAGADF